MTPGRRTNGRRDRKTRAPSSQSSVETSESQLATSNGPTVTVMLSPSWTPKYNFTEDLGEILTFTNGTLEFVALTYCRY